MVEVVKGVKTVEGVEMVEWVEVVEGVEVEMEGVEGFEELVQEEEGVSVCPGSGQS